MFDRYGDFEAQRLQMVPVNRVQYGGTREKGGEVRGNALSLQTAYVTWERRNSVP